MSSNPILTSPNYMVWQLFEALRRQCYRLNESGAEEYESAIYQDAALCVILAVQCVEVFLNVYFRVLVNEPDYQHAAEKIITDNDNTRCGLDRKIKDWPLLVFGKKLPLDRGAGQQFIDLKNLRHKLMHFTSSNETFSAGGMVVENLADISAYHSLSEKSGIKALHIAEDFLCEIFRLRGISEESFSHQLHSWTGRPPMIV